MKKPRLLLINDDGITSSGLYHLWHSLVDFADLTVVAPTKEQSGVGLSITLHAPIHVHEVDFEGTPAFGVSGTPADCVKVAISLLDNKPDLIVSGINKGSNAGRNLLYSGTVGGVIEGVLRGVPGMALSSIEDEEIGFLHAKKYVKKLVEYLLTHPLPQGTLLNVNVPTHVEEILGIKLAKQGRSYWIEDYAKEGSGYWTRGKEDMYEEHPESDIALLQQGFIAAVPVFVDELTHHTEFEKRKQSFDGHFV